MEVLIGASLVVAFIAGIAALFAPCCITVLLPSYLGSVFRQKRTVVLMTLVFFFGLLAVFLPLGLGIAGLGQLLSEYHSAVFVAGAVFLLLLGLSILAGFHFSLPFSTKRNPQVKGAASVFSLGVFSGLATLCCAPVLAGVIASSALPGSIFWGGIYTLAYVSGMVAPLLVIAFFLDKTDVMGKLTALKKQISYSLAGKKVRLTIAEAVSGTTFFLMGVLILYLAKTGRLAMSDGGYQTTINIYLAKLTDFINRFLGEIPLFIAIVVIVAVSALVIRAALKAKKKKEDN